MKKQNPKRQSFVALLIALILMALMSLVSCKTTQLTHNEGYCKGTLCNQLSVQDSIKEVVSVTKTYKLLIWSERSDWSKDVEWLNGCMKDSLKFIHEVRYFERVPIENITYEKADFLPFEEGFINVYHVSTSGQTLGFVWNPSDQFETIRTTKQFNMCFIAGDDIYETLVHEIGHSFGLGHYHEDPKNHQSYGLDPNFFFPWQLSQMVKVGCKFRGHNSIEN